MDGAAEAGRTGQRAGLGLGWAGPPSPLRGDEKAAVAVARPGRESADKTRLEESAGARPHEVPKVGRPRPAARQAPPHPFQGPRPAEAGAREAGPSTLRPLSDSLPFRGRDATWGGGGRETERGGRGRDRPHPSLAAGGRRGVARRGPAPEPPSAAARAAPRPVPLYITARGAAWARAVVSSRPPARPDRHGPRGPQGRQR